MKKTNDLVIERIIESAESKYRMLEQTEAIAKIADKIVEALKSGHKIVLFGNGGSAADAQHIAAEIVGSFGRSSRKALPAIALTANSSNLTAISNDYGFENVFTRQLEGLLNRGDVAIAISTSGNSPNVIKALRTARKLGAFTVGFCGGNSSKLCREAQLAFCAPSASTARIQECHITAGHIICEIIDRSF